MDIFFLISLRDLHLVELRFSGICRLCVFNKMIKKSLLRTEI